MNNVSLVEGLEGLPPFSKSPTCKRYKRGLPKQPQTLVTLYIDSEKAARNEGGHSMRSSTRPGGNSELDESPGLHGEISIYS